MGPIVFKTTGIMKGVEKIMTYKEAYEALVEQIESGLEGARLTNLKSEEWKDGAKHAYYELLLSAKSMQQYEIDDEGE